MLRRRLLCVNTIDVPEDFKITIYSQLTRPHPDETWFECGSENPKAVFSILKDACGAVCCSTIYQWPPQIVMMFSWSIAPLVMVTRDDKVPAS